MRRISSLVVLGFLLWTPTVQAVPDQTMTISPSPTSGTTITAADETSRNNAISTPYNAHTHNDIASTTANTFTVGNGLAGSKSLAISNSGTTTPSIRYNQGVTNAWQFTNDASTFLSMVGVTANLTTNAMLYASGTATLTSTAAPTNGQVLIGSTGAAPVLSTLTAGASITVTNAAGAITIASTAAGVSVKSGSFTRDTTLASGTQSITGVGFTPKAVIFTTFQDSSREASWGLQGATGTTNAFEMRDLAATADFYGGGGDTTSLQDEEATGTRYEGYVSTYGSDGFTVTWTRTGAPTGTITINYLAIG